MITDTLLLVWQPYLQPSKQMTAQIGWHVWRLVDAACIPLLHPRDRATDGPSPVEQVLPLLLTERPDLANSRSILRGSAPTQNTNMFTRARSASLCEAYSPVSPSNNRRNLAPFFAWRAFSRSSSSVSTRAPCATTGSEK